MTTTALTRLLTTSVTYRTIQSDDIGRLRRMFERCSRNTVRHRFHCDYPLAVPDRVLQRLTFVDYVTRHAVVATVEDEIVALAGFDRFGADQPGGGDAAEFAICVEDAWQRRGIGISLLEWLGQIARSRGVTTMTADVLVDNTAAIGLLRAARPDADVVPRGPSYAVRVSL